MLFIRIKDGELCTPHLLEDGIERRPELQYSVQRWRRPRYEGKNTYHIAGKFRMVQIVVCACCVQK